MAARFGGGLIEAQSQHKSFQDVAGFFIIR